MPDTPNQTWDDLYTEQSVTVPPVDEDDPINQIVPGAESPEDLELIAQRKDNLNDYDEDDLNTKKHEDDEPDNRAPEVIPPEVNKEDNGDVNMSGIELYLSQFDIEGGIIAFEDGTSKHFNELEPEKQKEILTQLHGASSVPTEEKYGLDENEIGLINYLRTNKLTVEEMVESMAMERLNTLRALQDVETTDYDSISEDAIYLQFLKRSNPEATADQLEDDLQKGKEQSNFSRMVANLRTQYKREQEAFLESKLSEDAREQSLQIEDQRKEVVNAVLGINDIAGVKIDDNLKNAILDKVLEVNEFGDSRFMEEAFSDPQRLFRAAFWNYYGESILQQRDNYWKQEKSKAYKRGREDALGKDSTKISFTSGTQQVKQGVSNESLDDDDWLLLHS